MSRSRTVIGEGMRVIVVLVAVAAALAVLAFQVHAIRILSPSMEPAIAAGDLALVRSIPTDDLEVGMVVLTQDPHGSLYLHRIISMEQDPAGPVLHTAGDANPLPDAWESRITTTDVSVMFARLPLGWLGKHLPAR